MNTVSNYSNVDRFASKQSFEQRNFVASSVVESTVNAQPSADEPVDSNRSGDRRAVSRVSRALAKTEPVRKGEVSRFDPFVTCNRKPLVCAEHLRRFRAPKSTSVPNIKRTRFRFATENRSVRYNAIFAPYPN